MEVYTEVNTYNVDYICDKCEGEMVAEDFYYASFPPLFPHKCVECGHKIKLRSQYPKTIYRKKD